MCLRSLDLGGGAVRSNLFKIILKVSYLKVSVCGNDMSASGQVHISSLKPPNKLAWKILRGDCICRFPASQKYAGQTHCKTNT